LTLRATYRLQYTAAFRFADGAALAPYLARLGVSHVYASPVFDARPGSTHGYDVTDPNRFNPELGTEAEFRAMSAAFRANGLGLILDIVPNHMGIGGAANRFWLSVLEWGEASPFARWFDIDWASPYPGLAGKVLVPFLGGQYGDILADGGLELRFDPADGSFAVWAHDTHKLPICPRHYGVVLRDGGLDSLAAAFDAAAPLEPTAESRDRLRTDLAGAPGHAIARALAAFAGNPGDLASWSRLDALIEAQHWRAAKFDLDSDAINYRRFFTISELAGVRVELPEVFDATHRLVLALIGEGAIDGVRIDHIDGLLDPKGYCLRLRERAARPFTLHVEKILAPDEHLPADWGTDGTTGYEFANLLVGLLADPVGTEAHSRTYAEFTGRSEPPAEIVNDAKLAIMARPMAAEVEAVVARLHCLASRDPRRRDLGRGALRSGLMQLVAALDVYRTYADADGLPPAGRARIEAAVAMARRRSRALDPGVFDFLTAVLTLDLAGDRPAERADVVAAALRVQQLSGPVMAKGLEDTALYRYNRLIALNEVGSEPGRFALGADAFHSANRERLARFPRALLATSTHDTKRGEDARARIVAIAGHAGAWRDRVFAWHDMLADAERPIDRNDEYFFYQLLLGAWPSDWPSDRPPPAEGLRDLTERVQAAMLKSAREAGVNTRWVFGDPAYEAALGGFVARALDPGGAFLPAFRSFEATIAADGAANSLVQVALKLTVPGVPDIYQGAELPEQSLVDPDNRRPVDFARRAAMLEEGPSCLQASAGGAAKLALTAALLDLRRASPALFEIGSYEPLSAAGPAAPGLCAFARRHERDVLVVAAALHAGSLGPGHWAGTRLALPDDLPRPLRNVVDGAPVTDLAPAALFRHAPVAVLRG
jgi:(1->4)-alpha-D-glucan 1-alpha-D-glucosylmutase